MNQKIIYNTPEGTLAVLTPSPEILAIKDIYDVARKDVPEGIPFKIISSSDLPEDEIFRDAWVVDSVLLTDGVGAASNKFEEV